MKQLKILILILVAGMEGQAAAPNIPTLEELLRSPETGNKHGIGNTQGPGSRTSICTIIAKCFAKPSGAIH
jgi:hypothetical protein